MDMKSAFLNDYLNEEVEQPKGFVNMELKSHVYKLKKALYS